MELTPSSEVPSPEAFVKALYVGHKAVPRLTEAIEILSRVEEMGIGLVKASEFVLTLYGQPTLIALRAQHYVVFDKFFAKIGQPSNSTNKIITVLQKTDHPDADAFVRCLKTIKERSRLLQINAELSTLFSPINLACFKDDARFSCIQAFASELLADCCNFMGTGFDLALKSHTMMAKTKQGTASKLEKIDYTTQSSQTQQKIYEALAKTFKKERVAKILEILDSECYAQNYAEWYQKAVARYVPKQLSGFKTAIRVSLLTNDSVVPPSKLTVGGLTWKLALKEKKEAVLSSAQQAYSSQHTVKAADDSYVSEETTEYVVIEDPRNEMQIIIYKTREPESEKAPEIGYHHRVSDLFMMDRAKLVTKIATEKSISPLIANEAVRQKTPALIADQYLQYAHDDIFIDKSGRNIPNKTLFCRVVQKSGLTKEYFLVWGFLDDKTCYHRGLSFNSSIDDSLKSLAYKTRYDFDFPELEQPIDTKKTT